MLERKTLILFPIPFIDSKLEIGASGSIVEAIRADSVIDQFALLPNSGPAGSGLIRPFDLEHPIGPSAQVVDDRANSGLAAPIVVPATSQLGIPFSFNQV